MISQCQTRGQSLPWNDSRPDRLQECRALPIKTPCLAVLGWPESDMPQRLHRARAEQEASTSNLSSGKERNTRTANTLPNGIDSE